MVGARRNGPGLGARYRGRAFARGGLVALAVDPTVRIVVLPGNPNSPQVIPAVDPSQVIPQVLAVPPGHAAAAPWDGTRHVERVRGRPRPATRASCRASMPCTGTAAWTSSSARKAAGNGSILPDPPVRRISRRKVVGWLCPPFDLQRQVTERFGIAGPFRVILAVADTAGATLGMLGAGWAEPAAGLACCRLRSSPGAGAGGSPRVAG